MTKSQFNAANLHMQYVAKDLFVEDHVLQSACDSAGLDPRWRRDPVKTSRIFTRAVKAVELPEHHEVRVVKSKDKEVSSKEITIAKLLQENGYEIEEKSIVDKGLIEEFQNKFKQTLRTVPQVVIDDKLIGGFAETEVLIKGPLSINKI